MCWCRSAVLGRPFLERLNRAGASGDDCWDAASQRLDDDQAVRLDPGRQHQQIGGIPFLIKRRTGQRPGHQDPIPNPAPRSRPAAERRTRISLVGADQVSCPRKVRQLRQRVPA